MSRDNFGKRSWNNLENADGIQQIEPGMLLNTLKQTGSLHKDYSAQDGNSATVRPQFQWSGW